MASWVWRSSKRGVACVSSSSGRNVTDAVICRMMAWISPITCARVRQRVRPCRAAAFAPRLARRACAPVRQLPRLVSVSHSPTHGPTPTSPGTRPSTPARTHPPAPPTPAPTPPTDTAHATPLSHYLSLYCRTSFSDLSRVTPSPIDLSVWTSKTHRSSASPVATADTTTT